ncbi:disulfide bond formation protein DsbB [Alteromonadaceae bacterium BrNp21-10]|nr:disulfide bond formation protein DsbB [Alteromonadaceae bacterium BrNp21-10]
MFKHIASWPEHPGAWKLLALSALALEVTALYFQYVMDLAPCIMCVYQRTAILGILVSAIFGIFVSQHGLLRFIAMLGWGVSAVWGLLIAYEHVDIQTSVNSFFANCEIVPNFPAWMPLHEWLPQVFAATGDCGDIEWRFMSMSMPQWMMVIFGFYTVLVTVVFLSRLQSFKRI